MRPRKLDHVAIEAEWFNRSLTREQVTEKHKASPRAVADVWSDAVAAGRLPGQNRLQWFKENPPEGYDLDFASEAAFAGEIASEDTIEDPAPACCVPDGDPLLAALRKRHGNDPRRALDDKTPCDRRLSPSPGLLRDLARGADLGFTLVRA